MKQSRVFEKLVGQSKSSLILANVNTLLISKISNSFAIFLGHTFANRLIGTSLTDVFKSRADDVCDILYSLKSLQLDFKKIEVDVNTEFGIVEGISLELHLIDEFLLISANSLPIEITAEDKIDKITERHEVFTNFAFEGIAIDKDGYLVDANNTYAEMFGYSLHDILGKPTNTIVFDDDHHIADYHTSNFEHSHYEIRGKKKNGDVIYLEILSKRIIYRGQESKLAGLRDITDRKKLEYALEDTISRLQRSQEKFAKTLDIAQIASWEYDTKNNAVNLSKEAYKMLGLTETNFNFGVLKNHCHPEDWQMAKEHFFSLALGKELNIDVRVMLNGRVRYINIQGAPYQEYSDGMPKFFGTFQDITNRKLQERELLKAKTIAEKATKVKDLFLANITHEIRTPLNSIIGFTGILVDRINDAKLASYVNTINSSSQNLLYIINEVLDFTKLEAEAVELEAIDFNLKNNIDYVTSLFKQGVEKSGVNFITKIDINTPLNLIGDPYRLNQVLTNLLSNSVKFTKQGSVTLEIEQINRTDTTADLLFSITDTGIGIAKENIDKIFKSFTQANSDISRRYGGTGLGLSIVKHLVNLQGGAIDVKSEIGKGTTFAVKLSFGLSNVNFDLNTSTVLDEHALIKDGLKGLKILVAEDHSINQLLIEEVFSSYECYVKIADNGLVALEYIENERFDIVLMDLQMPEMNGYETTNAIRTSNKQYAKIPIIALTADAIQNEMEKCLAAGMDDYLSKPFHFPTLAKKIINFTKIRKPKSTLNVEFDSNSMSLENQDIDYNLSYLKEVTLGKTEHLIKIIQLFVSDTPSLLLQAEQLEAAGEYNELFKILHKIKGSLGLLSAKQISSLVQTAEQDCKESTPDKAKISVLLAQISERIPALINQLELEINSLKMS